MTIRIHVFLSAVQKTERLNTTFCAFATHTLLSDSMREILVVKIA